VDGIIGLEHSPSPLYTRVRLTVSAKPIDDTPPKSEPDEESLGAGWFTMAEIKKLPLRGPDVLDIFSYIESGGSFAPMTCFDG